MYILYQHKMVLFAFLDYGFLSSQSIYCCRSLIASYYSVPSLLATLQQNYYFTLPSNYHTLYQNFGSTELMFVPLHILEYYCKPNVSLQYKETDLTRFDIYKLKKPSTKCTVLMRQSRKTNVMPVMVCPDQIAMT